MDSKCAFCVFSVFYFSAFVFVYCSVRLCSPPLYSATLRKARSQAPQPAAKEPAGHPSQQPPSQPSDQPTSTQPQKATQKHTRKLYLWERKYNPFLNPKIVQKCVTIIKNSLFEDLDYVGEKNRKWTAESTKLRRGKNWRWLAA